MRIDWYPAFDPSVLEQWRPCHRTNQKQLGAHRSGSNLVQLNSATIISSYTHKFIGDIFISMISLYIIWLYIYIYVYSILLSTQTHIYIYIYIHVNIHMLANKLLNSWPQLRVAGWQPSVLKQGGKFCWLYPYPPFNGLRILTTILSKISSIGWTNMIIFDFVVYTHFFGYGTTYMDPPEWMVTSRNLWVF